MECPEHPVEGPGPAEEVELAQAVLTTGTCSYGSGEGGDLSPAKVHPNLLFVRLKLLPSPKSVLTSECSGIKGLQ